MGSLQHLLGTPGFTLTLAESPYLLVSVWKPLLLLPPLLGWAWVVTNVYDKFAERFRLNRKRWNTLHLSLGLVAILAAFAVPIKAPWTIGISLVVMSAILLIDLIVFPLVANKDERVPEDKHLKFDTSSWKEKSAAKKAEKVAGTAELAITRSDGVVVKVPDQGTPEFDLRVEAEKLVIDAREAHADRFEIRPTATGAYQVIYTVHTVKQPGPTLEQAAAVRTIDFWKGCADLDVEDRRRVQTGTLNFNYHGKNHKVKVTTKGGQAGMLLAFRLDPEKAVRRKPENLGLPPAQLETLRSLVEDFGGIVLLTSPPGHGGTTTFYTVTRMHDAYTQNVQTAEFEQEDLVEGVRQNLYDPSAVEDGQEFSTLIRSLLRRDPDVLAIERVDADTAAEICRADLERTRVYVHLPSPSPVHAMKQWAKLTGSPEVGFEHVKAIMSQRVFRKLCENCKVEYKPPADLLAKLGLPADKIQRLYKKSGQVMVKGKNEPQTCPVCLGEGYKGTDAAFELLMLSRDDRALLKAGDLAGLTAELRKRGHASLQRAALGKAVQGVTSIEEVIRVTQEGEKKPKAPAKPAPKQPA
ncbi:MAG: ATPase, T2SS/T4P/T4SS family [Planctomycetota bacterium]